MDAELCLCTITGHIVDVLPIIIRNRIVCAGNILLSVLSMMSRAIQVFCSFVGGFWLKSKPGTGTIPDP